MIRLAQLLMVASIGLAIVGLGLAIAQPGDLGDGDDDATTDIAEGDEDGTTSVPDEQATSSTTTSPATTPTTDTTQGPASGNGGGSGLGSEGAAEPDDTASGLADTGGESLLAVAAVLALLALALRPRHPARITP